MEKIRIPRIKMPKEIERYRSQMVDELLASPTIVSFLKENNLDENFVTAHVVELMQMEEENRPCLNCPGYTKCQKKPKGFTTTLEEVEGNYEVTYKKCQAYIEVEPLVGNYDYFDVPTEDWYYNSLENIALNTPRRKIATAAINLLQNPTGKGIYAFGSGGVGKSYILTALVNDLIRVHHVKASIVNVRSFLDDCKQSFDKNTSSYYLTDRINALQSIPVLLLDDIGSERNSKWSSNVLYDIIDMRSKKKMLTLYTSRYDLDELRTFYKEFFMDRIADAIKDSCEEIEVKGINLAQRQEVFYA